MEEKQKHIVMGSTDKNLGAFCWVHPGVSWTSATFKLVWLFVYKIVFPGKKYFPQRKSLAENKLHLFA